MKVFETAPTRHPSATQTPSPFFPHCPRFRCRRAGRCRKKGAGPCAGLGALRRGVPARLMAMVEALGRLAVKRENPSLGGARPHVAGRR